MARAQEKKNFEQTSQYRQNRHDKNSLDFMRFIIQKLQDDLNVHAATEQSHFVPLKITFTGTTRI